LSQQGKLLAGYEMEAVGGGSKIIFVEGPSSGRKDALKSGLFLTGGQTQKIISGVTLEDGA
jgi:hypothetical protein